MCTARIHQCILCCAMLMSWELQMMQKHLPSTSGSICGCNLHLTKGFLKKDMIFRQLALPGAIKAVGACLSLHGAEIRDLVNPWRIAGAVMA